MTASPGQGPGASPPVGDDVGDPASGSAGGRLPAATSRSPVTFRLAQIAAVVGALAIAVPALLYRLGDVPIIQWDEARVANQALEMARSGLALAPTYGGVVDHYLLKPPLAAWLEAISILVVGPTEMAVRLVSVLAAFGTGAILVWLLGAHLRRPLAAFVAIAVLFSSAGYLDFHGARSGDVDSLLTFLVLAWLVAAFLYVEGPPERRRRWLLVWTACASLAFLDKSAAGLMALPAVVLYAWWRGRLRELLARREVWGAIAGVAFVAAAYVGLREIVDPGYAALAIGHDLLDRTATTLEGHVGPPWYYIVQSVSLEYDPFTGAFPLLVPSVIATSALAVRGSTRVRPIAGLLALAMVVVLAELAVTATKLPWYAIPVYPLAAAGVGLLVSAVGEWIAERLPPARRLLDAGLAVAGIALVVVVVQANEARVEGSVAYWRGQDVYATGLFLDGPVALSGRTGFVVAVDPDRRPVGFFAGQVAFYARAIARDNRPATLVPSTEPLPAGTSQVVSCGQATAQVRSFGTRLAPLLTDGSCGLYAIVGSGRPDDWHGQVVPRQGPGGTIPLEIPGAILLFGGFILAIEVVLNQRRLAAVLRGWATGAARIAAIAVCVALALAVLGPALRTPPRVRIASTVDGGPSQDAFLAMVAACETETSVSASAGFYPPHGFQDSIGAYLRATPDDVVTWPAGEQMRSLATLGLVTPVSDIWAGFGAHYSDAVKAASTGVDGQQYLVPMARYPWVVIYRRSVFGAHGYQVPRTLDQFVALAERMRADGLTPLAFGDVDGWPAMGVFDILDMRLNGYQFHIDLLAGRERWTDPRVAAVFARWATLLPFFQAGSPDRSFEDAARSLLDGHAGMAFSGTFLGEVATDPAVLDDLELFPFPLAGNAWDAERAIDAPLNGYVLSRSAQDVAGAKRTLYCLSSGDAQNVYVAADPTAVAAASDALTIGYTPFQRSIEAALQGSIRVAQFLGRDTRPDFAGPDGIPRFLRDFVRDPGRDMAGFLAGIQAYYDALPPLAGP